MEAWINALEKAISKARGYDVDAGYTGPEGTRPKDDFYISYGDLARTALGEDINSPVKHPEVEGPYKEFSDTPITPEGLASMIKRLTGGK